MACHKVRDLAIYGRADEVYRAVTHPKVICEAPPGGRMTRVELLPLAW